jgi:CRP/FNR family cyclic AMP-dependent transcriptional regulator
LLGAALEDIISGLKQVPYFCDVSEETLQALASKAHVRTFPKNAVVITEGDQAGPLYVILSGKARVFLSNAAGKEITLSIQTPGSYFGELSLLDDDPRSTSVMTLEKTVCGLIAKDDFKSWLAARPDAAASVIKGLTRRVRALTESTRSLALFDVYGRLSRLLYELAEDVDGCPTVVERPSHQDIASRIGSSREMVSKIMKDLVSGGYVMNAGKALLIKRKLPAFW